MDKSNLRSLTSPDASKIHNSFCFSDSQLVLMVANFFVAL